MAVTVSNAEVDRIKAELVATKEFIEKLTPLVQEFEAKVSPKNSALRSMQRFLKASV